MILALEVIVSGERDEAGIQVGPSVAVGDFSCETRGFAVPKWDGFTDEYPHPPCPRISGISDLEEIDI